jgi:membrane-associated HD superfamily phosphohydrolase
MLPTLALLSALIGLLLILFLIHREQKSEIGSRERSMLMLVSVVMIAVAAWHIGPELFGGGGGGH